MKLSVNFDVFICVWCRTRVGSQDDYRRGGNDNSELKESVWAMTDVSSFADT